MTGLLIDKSIVSSGPCIDNRTVLVEISSSCSLFRTGEVRHPGQIWNLHGVLFYERDKREELNSIALAFEICDGKFS